MSSWSTLHKHSTGPPQSPIYFTKHLSSSHTQPNLSTIFPDSCLLSCLENHSQSSSSKPAFATHHFCTGSAAFLSPHTCKTDQQQLSFYINSISQPLFPLTISFVFIFCAPPALELWVATSSAATTASSAAFAA